MSSLNTSPTAPIAFTESKGGLIAKGPIIDHISSNAHFYTNSPSLPFQPVRDPHITIIPSSEYKNLTPQFRTLATTALSNAGAPHPLSTRSVNSKEPDAALCFVTIFWPGAALLRAKLTLPQRHFRIVVRGTPGDSHLTLESIVFISPAVPLEPLLDAIRQHLREAVRPRENGHTWRVRTAYRQNFAREALEMTELMATAAQGKIADESAVGDGLEELHRKIAETRLVCFRLLPGNEAGERAECQKLLEVAPQNPTSHLQNAISLMSAGQTHRAAQSAWKSLLLPEGADGTATKSAIALLATCQTVLNTVRLDVIPARFKNGNLAYEDYEQAMYSTSKYPLWVSLNAAQRDRHGKLLERIETAFYGKNFVMRGPLIDRKDCRMVVFQKGQDSRHRGQLPQYFSWFAPFRLAASSIPRGPKDISRFQELGFNKVVTLCMERPLSEHWFTEEIQNVFLPVKDIHPPSFAQLDAFFAEATEEGARTVVHCMAGKGRTGTFLAAWAMLYGVDKKTILCTLCTAKLRSGRREQLRVGSCSDDACSMACREPVMSSDDAISFVRSLRTPSISEGRQEVFLKNYSSELWRRSSGSILGSENYGPLNSGKEHDSSPLKVFGNRPKRIPSLIVLCGLPGSGKSYVSRSISHKLRNRCVVACQDEMGSKSACEFAISQAMKSSQTTCSIVDRCNLLEQDRAAWLDIAFKPKDAILVYLATPTEICIQRAQRRVNHKTVVPHKAERLIRSLSHSIRPPGEQDISRGFDAVLIAKGRSAVSELLLLFGIADGIDLSQQQTVSVSVSKESTIRSVDLVKFPRTRHLVDLGSTTRDDLHASPADAKRMLDLHGCDGMTVHLEEKVDGSNIGFSLDPDTGAIRVQNRSHFVNEASHAQYKLLPRFIERFEEDLRKVLGEDPNKILFGEWLYARHSVSYSQLPSYFLAFDLYDGSQDKFVSRARFADSLTGTDLNAVQEVHLAGGGAITLDGIVDRVKNGRSVYGDVAIEGIYARLDQGDWLVERAKVVRPGFIVGNAHWSRQGVQLNGVVEGGEIYAYNY